MISFLQDHYNRAMDAGGCHISYAIINDLDDETAAKLRREYQARPKEEAPSVEEKAELESALKKEEGGYRQAAAQDDLDWLFGTGRFAQ